MDRDFFLNAGIQPMPTWQNIPDVSPETLPEKFFVKPTWEPSLNPNSGNDGFAIRELIGKLGTICNSDEIKISPEFLNSPPELQIPAMESLQILHNSVPISPNFPGISADPGFVERAAKFSCYGNRSFNGRTTQFEERNADFKPVCNNPLPRISSSPVMNLAGPSSLGFLEIKNSFQEPNTEKNLTRLQASAANSNEDSSVSEQNPCHKTVKTPPEINSRKRKAISKGKQKEIPTKEDEGDSKKAKKVEKKEESKAEEPFKDYIHVRARRGQATDSHSLAERVRREKISERMKLLQDLVPGCNKVTGKALMLDEIINYVQSLQHQVEFLSMKLASVNPRMEYNMETHAPKDLFQQNGNLHHPNFEIDSSNLYGHHTNISSGLTNGLMGPLDTTNCHNNGFVEAHPQFPTFFEEDLHSLVQMGFADNVNYSDPNQKCQMKLEL